MRPQARTLLVSIILILASLACNFSSSGNNTPQAAATLDQLYTAAALTVQASVSQVGSSTPLGTGTSPFPTISLLTPSLAPVPVTPCDAAVFVKDVTISDGTTIGRGASFRKIWRIQNVGTCSWTPSFSLVFVGGDRLNAPASVGLSDYVNPGQTIDLSINMIAPNQNGHYQGFWELRDQAGVLFGIGAQAQSSFWVDINVSGPTYTFYDFAANYCNAVWQNNNNVLPCPGSQGDNNGYVIELDHPIMENGKTEDQAGLLTVPKNANNGLIQGAFPSIKIQDGDRFQALINCQYKSYSCNVIFRLEYQIGGGSIKTLGQWNEGYEGKYYPVDIDLSSFAGNNVKFIMLVMANGSPNQDNALWFAPHITRLGTPPPTPTFTPTSTATPTFTPTSTATSTSTPTATFTPTPTFTPTNTPTDTHTPTPTSTP
jgi:hypothetical protein